MPPDVKRLVAGQRRYFAAGRTRAVDFRIQQLQKLKDAIESLEPEIMAALKKDLGKGDFEAYTSEVGFLYEEIAHTLRHIRDWARPRRVPTPLMHQPGESRIHPEPKGVVLIIGPWNYPFQLVLAPLVGAIAAGNCAVLKPSEHAPATESILQRLIEKTFSPEYCAVVTGGVPETTALLAERFDHVFFTGSTAVGRIVARAAAEHLTPVTLELGGKSPCLVDRDVDTRIAARRIAWAKFYNAGQTCVAPDYLLVHKSVKKDLLGSLREAVHEFFGEDPQKSPDYARIVDTRHFDRLTRLLDDGAVILGGVGDRGDRYLAPTVLDEVPVDAAVMQEEIFGPILPVIGYDSLDDALQIVQRHPQPLALYVFTRDAAVERRVLSEVPFGGGCVNNALVHLANPHLPFGGIGPSGMGAYHGKESFDTFSHRKAILKSPFALDVKLKYPPYKDRLKLIRRFFM